MVSAWSVSDFIYSWSSFTAYIVVILVYHLRQEVGDSVEDGGLDQDHCHRNLRHPVLQSTRLMHLSSLSLSFSLFLLYFALLKVVVAKTRVGDRVLYLYTDCLIGVWVQICHDYIPDIKSYIVLCI